MHDPQNRVFFTVKMTKKTPKIMYRVEGGKCNKKGVILAAVDSRYEIKLKSESVKAHIIYHANFLAAHTIRLISNYKNSHISYLVAEGICPFDKLNENCEYDFDDVVGIVSAYVDNSMCRALTIFDNKKFNTPEEEYDKYCLLFALNGFGMFKPKATKMYNLKSMLFHAFERACRDVNKTNKNIKGKEFIIPTYEQVLIIYEKLCIRWYMYQYIDILKESAA